MFPVTSAAEMAGQEGENDQADAAAAGNLPQVWEEIAEKLRQTPAYLPLFEAAFPEGSGAVNAPDDITYVHAANAIAAYRAALGRP